MVVIRYVIENLLPNFFLSIYKMVKKKDDIAHRVVSGEK